MNSPEDSQPRRADKIVLVRLVAFRENRRENHGPRIRQKNRVNTGYRWPATGVEKC